MDEDFLHERKIDYGADSQGLPEWHDANRFYNAERPQLPQVEIKIPITYVFLFYFLYLSMITLGKYSVIKTSAT
jgi:hypothetical protein